MSAKISSSLAKQIQAERLLYNIDQSFEGKLKFQTTNNEHLWEDFLKTIDFVLLEGGVEENQLLKLRARKSRLELELSRLKTSKISVPSISLNDFVDQPDKPNKHSKNNNPKQSGPKSTPSMIVPEPVNDKESAENIQRLLQDQKVIFETEFK
jgi:hypothetical protein